MKSAISPELSVVIPVLNEAETLPALFAILSRQECVDFEVLLVDGGSVDGTFSLSEQFASTSPLSCRIIQGDKGRGRQLNAGARAAAAETLLFLHADSGFCDSLAFRRALDALSSAIARRGHERIAGRFALRFDLPPERLGFGYYFYQCKARLDRTECTHGDQGFLIRRDFFESAGPFDEMLPLLEDTRLAEKIHREGKWILLPAEILTSARRFEAEGLFERQLLNALIMNFAAIGWDDFFGEASGIYRTQDRTRKLQLIPYLTKIRDLLLALPLRRRWQLWYQTGSYVLSNAWQIAFAHDARRNFRQGQAAGEGEVKTLESCERWLQYSNHPPMRFAVAVLVWVWFHLTFLWRRYREMRPAPAVYPIPSGEDE